MGVADFSLYIYSSIAASFKGLAARYARCSAMHPG
jgi:hypothetical protein